MYQLQPCDAGQAEGLRARLGELGESVAIAARRTAPATRCTYTPTTPVPRSRPRWRSVRPAASRSRRSAAGRPGRRPAAGAGIAPCSRWSTVTVPRELFAGEGASVLQAQPPGDSPAVSAQQLLRAVVDTGAASVMVLPNGYVAAEELVAGCAAAIGWGIDVVPLPTRSMVQGLAALAVHDPGRQAVDDGYNMAAAAGSTRFGSVRMATEEALTWAGPCKPGDGLGIFGGEVLVVRHDVTAAARGLIDLMLGVGGELVTVLLGNGLGTGPRRWPPRWASMCAAHHLGTELVTYDTGHDDDALLIGVE